VRPGGSRYLRASTLSGGPGARRRDARPTMRLRTPRRARFRKRRSSRTLRRRCARRPASTSGSRPRASVSASRVASVTVLCTRGRSRESAGGTPPSIARSSFPRNGGAALADRRDRLGRGKRRLALPSGERSLKQSALGRLDDAGRASDGLLAEPVIVLGGQRTAMASTIVGWTRNWKSARGDLAQGEAIGLSRAERRLEDRTAYGSTNTARKRAYAKMMGTACSSG
jgi:hypothetical protein